MITRTTLAVLAVGGLLEEVNGAHLQGRHGRLDGALAAQKDGRDLDVLPVEGMEYIQPAGLARAEVQIEDHQRGEPGTFLGQAVDGVLTGARAVDAEPALAQEVVEEILDLLLVVNDEDLLLHGSLPFPPRVASRSTLPFRPAGGTARTGEEAMFARMLG